MQIQPIDINDPKFDQKALDGLVNAYNEMHKQNLLIRLECIKAIHEMVHFNLEPSDWRWHIAQFARKLMEKYDVIQP